MDDDGETSMAMATSEGKTKTNTNQLDGLGHTQQTYVAPRDKVKYRHHRKESINQDNMDGDRELC
jgi:hypothetical protein